MQFEVRKQHIKFLSWSAITQCEDEEKVINNKLDKSVGKIAHRIQMSWYKNT